MRHNALARPAKPTAAALGVVGGAGIIAYVGSKHEIVGMTKTAALEIGNRSIRVKACDPGPIAGSMTFKLRGNVCRVRHDVRRDRAARSPRHTSWAGGFLLSDIPATRQALFMLWMEVSHPITNTC
ncbi:SDR family NAD(P)-dependent oxidoreductase [Mesorhizobium sp. B1-1-8]|uniref:SDR family NAD(P)-dependent oxidoreductase n=1 Tax=Mesorhizobium sp. B1-1-8 TaxID=2589976 RepID=UPI0015E3F28E|nr:SDR family oxidoreductase [Mesorhizobium sp. B1-1-8]